MYKKLEMNRRDSKMEQQINFKKRKKGEINHRKKEMLENPIIKR